MPNSPSSGLPNPQSYDTHDEATVLDKVTGLLWQRTVDPGSISFEEASQRCRELSLAGFQDWRLPSRIELVSLVAVDHTHPSIDAVAFSKTPPDWFWTASVGSESPRSAWYVYFDVGYPKTDDQSNHFSARCVRTATASSTDAGLDPHYSIAPSVVRDRGTGLVWQRAASDITLDFEGARSLCKRLELDEHTDWRLPSLPELLTLVDERVSRPAIDGAAFPATPSDSFWTSTKLAGKGTQAWYVYFDHGNALYDSLKVPRRVRCVRWPGA